MWDRPQACGTESILNKGTFWTAALHVTFPDDKDTGDAAEHTQEHTREAEEGRSTSPDLPLLLPSTQPPEIKKK